jgi:RNA polymerase sigma factor (sigma-70 family)
MHADQSAGTPEPLTNSAAVDIDAEWSNLNLALGRLEKSNSRYAKVVELRYFGGLSIDETAEVMQTSPMTVKRDWTAARAWLKQQMQPTKRAARN